MNEIGTKKQKTIDMIKETKNWFIIKIHEIDKSLAKFIKEQESAQIVKSETK